MKASAGISTLLIIALDLWHGNTKLSTQLDTETVHVSSGLYVEVGEKSIEVCIGINCQTSNKGKEGCCYK